MLQMHVLLKKTQTNAKKKKNVVNVSLKVLFLIFPHLAVSLEMAT